MRVRLTRVPSQWVGIHRGGELLPVRTQATAQAISGDSRGIAAFRGTVVRPSSGTRRVGGFNGLAMGGNAATRDDVTDGRAFAGVRIPDLDLYVVTFGDNIVSLSVVTGEATEGDLGVGPGRDVASD